MAVMGCGIKLLSHRQPSIYNAVVLFFGLVLPIKRQDGFVAVRHLVPALISISVASTGCRRAAAAFVRSHSCRIKGAFRTWGTRSRPRSSRPSRTALSKREGSGYQESDGHCDYGEFHCRNSFGSLTKGERQGRRDVPTLTCHKLLEHVRLECPRCVAEPAARKSQKSTSLSLEDEAIIVAFRKHTLLPLDDCLLLFKRQSRT